MADTSISNLQAQINQLNQDLLVQSNRLGSCIENYNNKLNTINSQISTLQTNDSDINNYINNLTAQVATLRSSLASESQKLGIHLSDCESKIREINNKISLLQGEDEDIHQEIHDLAEEVDAHTTRINIIELKDYQSQIDSIKIEIDDIRIAIDDMDVEHHNELHLLAQGIEKNTIAIEQLQLGFTNIPNHVVLSESEYDLLTDKDPHTFYFVFEEE